MYEELVKSLRCCAAYNDDLCSDCKYHGMYVDLCYDTLKSDAADVIEKLEKSIPHWIPVTERLPEKAYACLAIVWDNNPHTGDTFLNYYPEFVGYGGGSWNDYNGDEIPLDVVYWMKLPQIPEPPKEE